MAATVWVGGCQDDHPILGPEITDTPVTARGPIVSDPVPTTAATRSGASFSADGTSGTDVVYVSLPPGTIPDGGLATIRNTRTGSSVLAAMAAGGFDPVPVEAVVGDTLAVEVQVAGGGSPVSLQLIVPTARPPIVVRTDPPPRKRDVPLNARMVIVFSEPIRGGTVASIRLLRGGAPVSGRAALTADALRATFQPDLLLAPNTDYVLSVPTDVTDLSGDALEDAVLVEFTTGSMVAVASVATDPVALFTRPSGDRMGGDVRTMAVSASLLDDGRFTGSFSIFYPGTGGRVFGRVACFTIVDSTAAWVAGIVEGAGNPAAVGVVAGWRMIDHGLLQAGVPDQLSLAWVDTERVLGTAEDWCATTPVTWPGGQEIHMFGVESGNVVVNPAGPPPPPPPGGMSEIAFAAVGGGIQVINADGSGGRVLTTARGDFSPTWSPDGTRLAFQRLRAGASDFDIFVMNYDGSGVIRLTSDSSNHRDPAWSPDGTKIAFDRNGDIYVMNAKDGSDVTRLTGQAGVDDSHPTWSPDGSRIAFASFSRIYVMNADGSGLTQLTNEPGIYRTPAWSPDGNKIAFGRSPSSGGGSAIYVMNADGTGIRRLTLAGQTPAWSPDSRMVIYEDFGINIVSLDGSGRMRRGSGFTPAWSPVGVVPPPPQPYLTVQIAGGDAQTDTVLATLAQPLSVRLVRDDATPAPGVRVDWYLVGAGQSPSQPKLSTYVTRTDSSGMTSVWLTLGSVAGRLTVRAVVTDGSAHSDGVEFTATAKPGTPVMLCCSYQGGVAEVNSTADHSVYTRDGHGHPVTGVRITWAVTSGGGSITPAQDTTAQGPYGGEAYSHAVHTFGPNEGTSTVTATAPTMPGAPQVSFESRIVTAVVSVPDYAGEAFNRASVSVPSGRTVAWIWWYNSEDSPEHNVTFEDDATQPTSSPTQGHHGDPFFRTFVGSPRTIRYRCTLHSTSFTDGEVGTVTVQ